MDRRGFLRVASGAASMWPLTTFAQKVPVVIGFLGGQPEPPSQDPQGIALLQGFADYGLVVGRDFVFESRFTAGDDARFPEFARELARLKVRIILTNSPAGVRAAQRLQASPMCSPAITAMASAASGVWRTATRGSSALTTRTAIR